MFADSAGEFAIVTHLSSGPLGAAVTLIDSPKAGSAQVADVLYGVFQADPLTGLRGATGVAGRTPNASGDIILTSSAIAHTRGRFPDALRRRAREAGGEFHVVKNTLARRALDGAGVKGLDDFLAAVGYGDIHPHQIAVRIDRDLKPPADPDEPLNLRPASAPSSR